MHLSTYLTLLYSAEGLLGALYDAAARTHRTKPGIAAECGLAADNCRSHRAALRPIIDRYAISAGTTRDHLPAPAVPTPRRRFGNLERDLQDLQALANLVETSWTVVAHAADANQDTELQQMCRDYRVHIRQQQGWLARQLQPVTG